MKKLEYKWKNYFNLSIVYRKWEVKLKRLFKLVCIIIAVVILVNLSMLLGKKMYPLNYSENIFYYSNKNNLDPYLVAAIIKAESNYNKNAVSCKNASGLMQITPETGKWIAEQMKVEDFDIKRLHEPELNISMGCWYLNNLRSEFKDMDLVIAAYNAGRGNVQKWLNNAEHSKDGQNLHNIPFKETDKYVKKVRVNYKIYKFLYDR
ncbi:lytic transglycosylase domain-containing protein [Clostridium tetani]|uniref:Lytic transglycosylase domain-containing protein n=1 Tax=Clostridium tetani TaxID=1513 RepID=A0A4Q0VE16_CLOTA|nr:lytic transglycosylase domain-containing protein [Clostridium tetani]RXI53776.1 lytic transglycosylase domain-containing protein [Clostridium tetani]RXI54707.1 lytic transglycosylase domain-containing protein [Clostridium tetani]RXM58393.1 lytic transglycosylase domain-containing protein [Clostridium tetani]RXM70425.1 lytic transglycosylase domain-containing protein [Clostridium tetani]